MNRHIKRIVITVVLIAMMLSLAGCATLQRWGNDIRSDWGNGLHRTIKVYTANGDLLAEYEGKIDIATEGDGYVKFDFNGKRYIYYNCFVETIADL